MTTKPEIRSGVEGEAPALGQKVAGRGQRLDVFDAPERHTKTTYRSDEVTAQCPITGQPDWYEVFITVQDTNLLVESKSLKLYLQSFREEGMFCEAFAEKIADDVAQAVRGLVNVTVKQKPRGGIEITSSSFAFYVAPPDPEEANLEVTEEP